MALFVATKSRIFVTAVTAGAMVAGVAGLQASAVEQAILAEAESVAAAASAAAVTAPTPTATTVVKKKKKKKKKKPAAATVVVQQAQAPAAKPAKNHGSSSGSK